MNPVVFSKVFFVFFIINGYAASAYAATIPVDCTVDSLQSAIETASPGDTLSVTGLCEESITITTNDLTFIGNSSGVNAALSGANLFFPTMISINNAARVSIEGFTISDGLFGVSAEAGATFTLSDSTINNMIIGMALKTNSNAALNTVTIDNVDAIGLNATSGSTVEISGMVTLSNAKAFGLQIIDGAELKVTENSELILVGNLLGAQISGGSTLFMDTDSKIIADDNILIGFSINTGSSMVMFNADLSANRNGLDGLDVVSSANLDIDGDSTLTVNDNRREGISIDNGSINIFGFFSTQPGLPKIITNNNANNGIQVEFGGKLDIGRNSSIESTGNGKAGISLDNGSAANLHDSIITGNNGYFEVNASNDDGEDADEENDNDHGSSRNNEDPSADVVVSFGSRVWFQSNNAVGLAICDKSSLSRGDVKCKH